MPFLFWDPTMILLIPAILLSLYASTKVKSAFNKFSQKATRRGISGKEVARYILQQNNLSSVQIEEAEGKLTDHYDPRKKVLRLSSENYRGSSIASLGVAAHEAGHAIQHGTGYSFLHIRNAIYPVANIGSNLAWPLVLAGFLFSFPSLIDIGIILFSGAVFFTLITLPVEFNASKRALVELRRGGFLETDELTGAKKVLDAAALTYVAAAAVAVLQLLRLLILRGSRD